MVSLLKTDLDGAGIVIAKIQNSGPIQELQWVSSRPQGRVFREVRELLGDGLLPDIKKIKLEFSSLELDFWYHFD